MPLLDHFRPPLSQIRHWDSFHGAWAEAMAQQLNQLLLPDHFVAEARVQLGGQVETATLDFQSPDLFEVQVLEEVGGSRLVAAIELVSPANKNRPSHRRMFAVKCASYLQSGVSVMIVDVVTKRAGNLHAELLQLLELRLATPGQESRDLYAAAYRSVSGGDELSLETWVETLRIHEPLPTLPLWIMPNLAVPMDMEATYQAACAARRIAI